ncbi:MAG: O-antigen ligase family protein [bacterium]|nr:O-antigen ligase family protein [bacterium]
MSGRARVSGPGGRFIRILLPGFTAGVLAGAAAMRFLSLPPVLVLFGLLAAGAGLAAFLFRKTGAALFSLLIATLIINIDKTFFLNPDHSGGAKGVIVALWNIVLLGFVALRPPSFLGMRSGRPGSPMWVWVPLLLLFAFSAFSLTQAVNPRLGLYQLLELTKAILLFLVLSDAFRDRGAVSTALTVLLVVYLIELAVGTVQYALNRDVALGILTNATTNSVRRIGDRSMISVSGTLEGSDRFASYLVMMLLLFMGWWSSLKRALPRLLLMAAVLAGTMLLVFTFSRGGWIGFAAGLLVFAFLHWRIAENRSRALFRGLIVLSVLSLVLWLLRDFILLRFTGEDYGSAQSRIPMMQIALGMIRKFPWLGVGLNNYTLSMAPFDKTGLTLDFFHPVHNVYLQLAAEIGLPGLVAFLAFTLGLYVRAARSLSAPLPDRSKQLIIGFISGITGLLIHHTVNNATIDSEAFLAFWLFAAAIVALSGAPQIESPAGGGEGGPIGLR